MTFDENTLKEIEEFAGLCFLPEQIATIIGCPEHEFISEYKNKSSEVYLAYQRGSLLYEAKVRKSIYDLAKGGSSTSQNEYMKLKHTRDSTLFKKS
jgi:hypothetical protein